MKWLKALTYAAATICGVAAFVFPVAAVPLGLAGAALAGWATKFPGDGKITPAAVEAMLKDAAEQTAKLRR